MEEDLYDIALEETANDVERENEENEKVEEEENPGNMQKYAVYVRKLIIGARKNINKLEKENEELKKNLENALNSSGVVTCPDCRHCFKERHHSIRPNHMKAFRANKCVELEFKSTEDMTDWLYLNQLETNSDGMPTVMKNENNEQDVSTLKSVGSKLPEIAHRKDEKNAEMRKKRRLDEEKEKSEKRIRIEIKKKISDESAPSTSTSKSRSTRRKSSEVEFGRSQTPDLVMASSSRSLDKSRRERDDEHDDRERRRRRRRRSSDRDEKSRDHRKKWKTPEVKPVEPVKSSILSRLSFTREKSLAVRKIDVGEDSLAPPPPLKTSFKIPDRKNCELPRKPVINEKLAKNPAPTTTKFSMLKEKKVENQQKICSQNDNSPDSPNLMSEFFPNFGRTIIVEPEIEEKEEEEEEDMSYWISGDAIESEGESDEEYVYPESSQTAENVENDDVVLDNDEQSNCSTTSQFVIPITPKIQTNLEKIGESAEEELDWDFDDGELMQSNYDVHDNNISDDAVPITPNTETTVPSENNEIEDGEIEEEEEEEEEEEVEVIVRSISPIQKENRKQKKDDELEELNRSRRGKRRNEWMAESYSNGLTGRSFGGRRN